ncbi:Zinc finger, RING/FYVE/PHD-type [Penicillium expansum]|uniref:Zinc finger, RING/FYVE/PHD-type n=1 Tax=Penicillium expansum TaxID=27334 RepID=A0A0A2KWG7_PENEN|nr:Zinc finger, RING/FYVE/PHD-type [Penicillium expansum]KGO43719.1 Zinc finger, RING/FYVE/PHD-type [Penicillium expansum]KGO52745.1 Zinc finger, RING/FYVE/PHD-type [Penicillium expansum]KGO68695.1 Zinc finger, RING/FYVE/PHD-type [Penicillium expansum]
MSSTPTSASSSAATTTASSGEGSGSNNATSSPLLFFVALGFGVVFTNLWIIVGVKYCFRYSQRNRQLRSEEVGEPIDLVTMPRPHRRRREKRLMTMDEVNGRFPLVKYKVWRSTRANQGLSTEGGITAPNSRPQSLKDDGGMVTTAVGVHTAAMSPSTKGHGRVDSTDTSQTPIQELQDGPLVPVLEKGPAVSGMPSTQQSTGAITQKEKWQHSLANESMNIGLEDHDDDAYIRNAVPTDLLPNPGDSCAICLDIIEDDDDIRGLACGHAFHASVTVQPRPAQMQSSDLLELLGIVAGQMDSGSRWAYLPEYLNRHLQGKEACLQPGNIICRVGEISPGTQSMSLILRLNLLGLD